MTDLLDQIVVEDFGARASRVLSGFGM
jgi:hypothetical protein